VSLNNHIPNHRTATEWKPRTTKSSLKYWHLPLVLTTEYYHQTPPLSQNTNNP